MHGELDQLAGAIGRRERRAPSERLTRTNCAQVRASKRATEAARFMGCRRETFGCQRAGSHGTTSLPADIVKTLAWSSACRDVLGYPAQLWALDDRHGWQPEVAATDQLVSGDADFVPTARR
jgi:hypothetical protein